MDRKYEGWDEREQELIEAGFDDGREAWEMGLDYALEGCL